MQSEPKPQQIDPGEVGIAPESEELGHVYKQVVREVLARIDQRLAEIEKQSAPDPSSQARRMTSRAGMLIGDGASFRRWAIRGAIGLVVFAGIAGAALALQSFDRDSAKSTVARWTPQFVLNLVSAKDSQDGSNQDTAQDPGAPPVAQSAADAAPAAPQTTADSNAAPAAPVSPDQAMLVQSQAMLIQKMARDIENLSQGVEQLKTSQDQMGRDSAKAADQLRASEDQLIRTILRISEQNAQGKTAQGRTTQDGTSQARNSQTRTSAAPPRSRPRSGLPAFLSRGAT
jgi:hypothetical protein